MTRELFLLSLLSASVGSFPIEPRSDDISLSRSLFNKKEGDILTVNQTKFPGLQSSALKDRSVRWPDAEVPYEFSPSFDPQEKQSILDAMGEIENQTCVRFRPVEERDAMSYVQIWKPGSRECSSVVGHTPAFDDDNKRIPQPLFLASACLTRRTILHELMHTLGFIHEHNRPDRNAYVTIWYAYIDYSEEKNFDAHKRMDLTLMDTAYAYDSIMHYTGFEFSINGKPTIVPRLPVRNMGGGEQLSDVDVKRINRYYECPGAEGLEGEDSETTDQGPSGALKSSDPLYHWLKNHCPNAYDPPKPGKNCRLALQRTKDRSSGHHYFECVPSPDALDPQCGTWKRRSCPPGEDFLASHRHCGLKDVSKKRKKASKKKYGRKNNYKLL